MTEAEKQAIDNFKFFNEGDYITKEMAESKETVLNLIEKKDKIIKILIDEREHIKNNLEVDLNKKGVYIHKRKVRYCRF